MEELYLAYSGHVRYMNPAPSYGIAGPAGLEGDRPFVRTGRRALLVLHEIGAESFET